ncbi:lactose transport system permease protein LacF [Lachnospiraceae bacterium]|nr:sugar ABC transporter permease [Lachnospiraceae bacterium]GFI29133.1 lactose transport system permease protein LacF [Lachnospiraceae bacterium]
MGRRKRPKRNRGRNLFLLCVLAPAFLWFLLFFILPFVSVIFYSFTNAHMAYSEFRWVGLDQYQKAFTKDPTFLISLKNTVTAALVIVPSTVVLSILLAAGLNMLRERMRQFFTFIYFLPSVISAVAISLVWDWLYSKNYGLFNAILQALGLEKQPFLSSVSQALFCLCIVQIWSVFGYYAVILLAAMRGIDRSYYEAAEIDGAGGMAKFFKITLPLIKNNILFVCIMTTTVAFMFFTPVKILTDGTPGTSTMVMLLHIMNKGIINSDIGYASAMSVILMLIILFFSMIQWVITKERKSKPVSGGRKEARS